MSGAGFDRFLTCRPHGGRLKTCPTDVSVRCSEPCWTTGGVRNAERQLRAFRGNGVCPGMPGGALKTQVAIGDLASCARVLATRVLTNGLRGATQASFVTAAGDMYRYARDP